MPHPLRTSVEDFIEGLKSFERELITKEAVRKYVDDVRLSAAALQPYTFFRDTYYTRNLVYRDDLFEVMAICWKPGQKTVIHTHDGQLGWMTVPQGEVAVHNYKYFACNKPENQNVVGHDCLAGATHIELDRLRTDVCSDSSPIYCVDKFQTIHQIENLDKSEIGVVSLHVYSLPIDSCVSFDLEKQRCTRKTLSFYSRFGKVEVEASPGETNPLKVLAQ
jgi:cysteine dioxygenase